MRQMFPLHLSSAPRGAPFFRCLAACRRTLLLVLLSLNAWADGDIVHRPMPSGDFTLAREAVIEAIEAEGLVLGTVLPIGDMLARTAPSLGKRGSPFVQAEIIQFCSAGLAWTLIEEMPAQLSLCPLSVALYAPAAQAGTVFIAFRPPSPTSPGRQAALDLLTRIVRQAQRLSGQR